MSAFNEEKVIVAKVSSLIAAAEQYGPATIHVFADAPGDRTVELLQPFADRIDLVVSPDRTGKTSGMNTLVARSNSEVLLFTDANVSHETSVVEKLVSRLADPTVGCCSAQLVYSNSEESPTAATGAAYWKLEERIKQIESERIGLIGVDGAMFAMRRSLHRPPPPYLIDDLYLSLLILLQGARVVSEPEAIVFERSAVYSGEEYMRKRRIACQAINVHRALWPELRRMSAQRLYGYISHRLLKWISPFLLAGAGLCFTVGGVMVFGAKAVGLAMLAGLLFLFVGVALRLHAPRVLASSLRSLIGVALGVYDSVVRRETYTVWNLAHSIRDGLEKPSNHRDQPG